MLRDQEPVARIKGRLTGRGEGEVSILFKRDVAPEEIEIRLPGGYSVNTATASALREIPGVLEVEYL